MKEIKMTPSSGNVFADMGIPDADHVLQEVDQEIAAEREARRPSPPLASFTIRRPRRVLKRRAWRRRSVTL